jgi:muconolactone delta-isomerase
MLIRSYVWETVPVSINRDCCDECQVHTHLYHRGYSQLFQRGPLRQQWVQSGSWSSQSLFLVTVPSLQCLQMALSAFIMLVAGNCERLTRESHIPVEVTRVQLNLDGLLHQAVHVICRSSQASTVHKWEPKTSLCRDAMKASNNIHLMITITQVHNTITLMIYCDVLLQGSDSLYKYVWI